jgi:hypothetical protein
LFFPAADTVAVSTAGVERLRVDSSGNVGIGTTSPATQLDLAANNTAGTALNVLRFTDTDLSVTAPQELGKIEFYSADNSAPGAGVKASITGIAEVGNPGGGIAFSTDLLTGTPIERMRIDRNGNVGIGTTTPTSIVDVYSATPTFNFRGDAATNITSTRSSNNSGGPNVNFIKARGTTASQTAVASSDYMGFLNFAAYGGATNRTIAQIYAQVSTYTSDTDISSSINFTTTPTGSITPQDRMRIDASGNVGIGTTSPNGLLELSSGAPSLYFRETDQALDEKMWRLAPAGSTLFLQAVSDDNLTAVDAYAISRTGTAINFQLWKTGGSERMRITSAGNVGIGTVSPSEKLSVDGNITMPAATTEDRFLEIGTGRTGNGNSYIDFVTDATYTDFGLRIIRGNSGANSTSLITHRGTGGLILNAFDSSFIYLQTSNTVRFVVGSAGQWGIGGATYGTAGQAFVSGGAGVAPSWTSVGTFTTVTASTSILSTGAGGIGYATGAGVAVTQLTSRTTTTPTTGAKTTGAVTLFTAAAVVGTYFTFTVPNTAIAATDTVVLTVRSATNTYVAFCAFITAATSFTITMASVAGVASDTPIVNFAIIKGVSA